MSQKLHQEGVELFRKGKIEEALDRLNQALAAAADNSLHAAEIYNDLGVVHRELEDYPAAHQALDEANARFAALDNQKGLAQVLGNRAAVFEAEGQLEKAVDAYKESASMLEELGESEMAMYVWQAVSRLRTKQGQYIAAIGAYEEGVSKMPKSSFKRKVLEKILKAPASLLGGSTAGGKSDDDNDDDGDEK